MISVLRIFDTVYSADSIEFCRLENFQNFFVCGTYQLDDNQKGNSRLSPSNPSCSSSGACRRKGRIYLLSYDLNSDGAVLQVDELKETDAVLDQKWHRTRLAVADSVGGIEVFRLNGEERRLDAEQRLVLDVERLNLALDWNADGDRVLVSDSKGDLSLVVVDRERMERLKRWNSHGFEAWTCAFDKLRQDVVYSGGDDTLLCCHDVRMDGQSVWRNRSHGAGVTSLLPFERHEFLLGSGSYDEQFRLFDTRKPKNPLLEFNLGGGVWRLRPHPLDEFLVLAANMYHNFSVFRIAESLGEAQSLAELKEHESICYGADWSHLDASTARTIIATCSFYDHKLCLSRVDFCDKN